MTDVFPQPGFDDHFAENAFVEAGFLTPVERNAPSLVLSGSGSIAWANRAAAALFQADDYTSLQKRFTASCDASPTRVSALLRSMKRGSPPRFERLRFGWGARNHTFTAVCVLGGDDARGSLLLLAFIGSEADSAGRASRWSDEAPGQVPAATVSRTVPPAADASAAAPADKTFVEGPSARTTEHDLDHYRDGLRETFGGMTCRFVWRTDVAGALTQIDDRIALSFGGSLSPDPQVSFAEQVAAFDQAGAERLENALCHAATWSGVEIHCPVDGGRFWLPLVLSGAPLYDASRRCQGFRGFGRVNIACLQSRAAIAPGVRDEGTSALPDDPLEARTAKIGVAEPGAVDITVREASSEDGSRSLAVPALEPRADYGLEPADMVEPVRDRTPAKPDRVAVERPANVVQLWPAHVVPPGRTPHQQPRPSLFLQETLAEAEAEDRSTGTVDIEPHPSIDADAERSLARKGTLSSSEHQAFQEIGRTLGAGRRGDPPGAAPEPEESLVLQTAEPMPTLDIGLTRHAAALVEHMSAGLLVIRGKKVLFANEALRETLRFDSHAELLDALGLHLARALSSDAATEQAAFALPSAYGDSMTFASTARVIVWNGQPATLWTLTRAGVSDTALSVDSQPSLDDSRRDQKGHDPSDLALVLDATGEAVAVIGVGGRILRLNRQAERFFGRDRGQIAGDDFTRLLAPESRAAATALLRQVMADMNHTGQGRGECVGRSTDGSSLVLEMRIARLDADRLAVIWRDLSTQRGLERELAEARRQAARVGDQQPDVLATVSHQVRTPLNAILGFTEIMMDERFGPLGNPRYKDYLNDIHVSGTQVVSLIDDLMDLSRIESGRLDLRLDALDINKIIGECVAEAQTLAHRERIIVRTSFSARLPPIMADERSARQIIGNLLSNAIKFNEPGGQVIVSTAAPDDSAVVVRIRDTGIGMSDSQMTSALEPFRQLASTKNASGTGLGLPLAKALVSANGASLSMRSRPAEGTMVEVTFQATVPAPTRLPA